MEVLFLFGPLVALGFCERLPRLRFERSAFLRPHFATDLFYFASTAVGLGLLVQGAASRLTGATGVLVSGLSTLPVSLSLAAAIVLYDLAAYVSHLLLHRSESLWRVHTVHHSSPTLDWLATFRAHFVEHGLRHLASSAVLLALGFPLWSVALAAALNTAWAAFVHSNLRLDLRSIEFLFITPRLHRLHHVPSTGDRNLGVVLSVWDRLRGSLLTDPKVATRPLGVPGEIDSYPQSWFAQLVEPFRSERGLRPMSLT
jgi:sterol desaturase/sphingolipid hydroxylase (fatty acid hydroxylase superfamily)